MSATFCRTPLESKWRMQEAATRHCVLAVRYRLLYLILKNVENCGYRFVGQMERHTTTFVSFAQTQPMPEWTTVEDAWTLMTMLSVGSADDSGKVECVPTWRTVIPASCQRTDAALFVVCTIRSFVNTHTHLISATMSKAGTFIATPFSNITQYPNLCCIYRRVTHCQTGS